MKNWLNYIIIVLILIISSNLVKANNNYYSLFSDIMGNSYSAEDFKGKSIFDFDVPTLDDKTISLNTYRGKKAYLIVNVASKWGLTKSNYKELNDLYLLHKDDGLEILGFPSADFGGQEFSENKDIKEFTCSEKVYI